MQKKYVTLLTLCLITFFLGCGSPDVTSLVRIKHAKPSPNSPHKESESEYKIFKETQKSLVTSPFVLNAALRRPGIAGLEILKNVQNKLHWLEDSLRVTSPNDSEIICVRLSSPLTDDAMKIVDAVVVSYLYEIGQAEKTEQSRQLQTLQTQSRRNEQLIKEKTEIVDRLSKQFGTQPGKSPAVLERKATLIERQILSISALARDLRLEQVTAKEKSATIIDAKLVLLEKERSELTESYEDLLKSMDEPQAFSSVLTGKRLELANLIQADRDVASRISELQLKLLEENRIQRVQPATYEPSSFASVAK